MTTANGELDGLAARAVRTALDLAAAEGWDQVRLHRIADRLEVPLSDLGRRFRDVDALANAWFRQARLAMLAVPPGVLDGLSADRRLALVLERWLDFLAPHRSVAREVLLAKLYPGHPQHWVPLIFDLSRLVHDLLDAARVPGHGRVRQLQEVGMTGIVLLTLAQWLRDDSPGQTATKERLARRLAAGGRLLTLMEPRP
jgi:AcrR family transcriptional regulator